MAEENQSWEKPKPPQTPQTPSQPSAPSQQPRSEGATPAPPPAGGPVPSDAAASTGRKSHVLGYIMLALAVLVVGGVLFRVLSRKPPKAPPAAAVRVSITNAAKGDIGIYVSALGTVVPVATVSVSSQVTGQLTRVNYVEGQLVKAGDLLLEIDERPFRATLMQAEGQLARDHALLRVSQIDLKRYQAAAEQNAIPQQQVDDQVQLTNQYAGTVKFDEGQVESAKVQLSFCRITSPVTGRVGLRLVDTGNLVVGNSTNALVVITELQPITIIFSVPEDYLPQIQHQLSIGNHMTVEAYDRALQSRIASGSVLALDNLIDSTTGTVRLRSIFTNEDNALFPNQFVNVRLLIDTLRDRTLIPASAVQRDAQNAFVYVVKSDETVEMRTVKTDATDGDTTAIEGVHPGEVLVTDNFNRLQAGAKVSPRSARETTEQVASQDTGKKSGGKKKGHAADAEADP